MSSAWVFQERADVRRLGEDNAPWHVGWYEPDGRRRKKSFGAGFRARRQAEAFRRKVEAELMTGTYQTNAKVPWADFRREYERRVLAGLAPATRAHAAVSLGHFERLVRPARVGALRTAHIDEFIAARRQEPGRKPGSVLSPHSLNKDLRHVKAALSVAVEWGYLRQLPRFRMERAPRRLPTYMTGDHFAAAYAACDAARKPRGLPYPPGDWWRGLLVFAYMTGWRIGDILALRRDRLDLEAGTAVSLAEDNKGSGTSG